VFSTARVKSEKPQCEHMFSVVHATTDIPANGSFAPVAAPGGIEIQLPLSPRKLTRFGNRGMSEKCQKQKSSGPMPTSGLPLKADIRQPGWVVR
jgi:hypothetical protein